MPATPEQLDVVDDDDRVVGSATIEECLSSGTLHRAVAVLVARSGGRFLLQQRSVKDLWQPGMWTLSCTGHVRRGETYRAAAARELDEELGLRAPLTERGKFLLPPVTEGPLTEHEWVALFGSSTDSDVRIDPSELQGAAEFSRGQLEAVMAGGMLTQDAKFLLRKYFAQTDTP